MPEDRFKVKKKEKVMNTNLVIIEVFKVVFSGLSTGLAIFFANRCLENVKFNDTRKGLAQIFISIIDIQCERIWWLQKRLDFEDTLIYENFSDLKYAFSEKDLPELFREEGVRFNRNILKELTQYLAILAEANSFLSEHERRVKAPFYGNEEEEKGERNAHYKPLIDSRIEATIIQGGKICERLYSEILNEKKMANKYIEARNKSIIPRISKKIKDFDQTNCSKHENPYISSLERLSEASISLLICELNNNREESMTD